MAHRVDEPARRLVFPVLLALAVLVAMSHPTPADASGSAVIWHGLGDGGPLGAEVHRVLGPISLVLQSGSKEEPSPSPSVSVTPITEAESVFGAFFERDLGPVSAGLGVAHLKRQRTGMVMPPVDPANLSPGGSPSSSGPTPVPISLLDEETTSFAATVRASIGQGPLVGEARAIATSEGVLWSVRAGLTLDRLSAGVGYQAGPTDAWWSGPLIFIGASW